MERDQCFGLEYLLGRIREEIRCPAIPEMTKYLDEYFLRLERNKQESMSAWALSEEKVFLQTTRAFARLEQTVGSTELDLNLLYERRRNWSRWNNWSSSWRANQDCHAYESVDGDEDTIRAEERDVDEVRMQEVEARFLLTDSPPKISWRDPRLTVLGNADNTLGRLRIMEVLKQQWPDHEVLVYDQDRTQDRDREMRVYAQGAADEWEPETHQNGTTTDSAWNANESRDAWEQASWDEAGAWAAEDDLLEGSFADEHEEEAFNLAGTQLNEAIASERSARRTVAQARAIVRDSKSSRGGYYLQGANKKGSEGNGKCKGQRTRQELRESWSSTGTIVELIDESSWN